MLAIEFGIGDGVSKDGKGQCKSALYVVCV